MLEILKAFLKTGSGAIANILFSALSVKVMAVVLGPSGYGLLSLLRDLQQTAVTAATLSGSTALVQGASAREGTARLNYLRTVWMIFLGGGLLIACLLMLAAPVIAGKILGRTDAHTVVLVRWLSLPVLLSVMSGFFAGGLNVCRALGRLALMQPIAAACTLALAYPVALWVRDGHEIAFIALMTGSVTASLVCGILFLLKIDRPSLGAVCQFAFSGEAARHFFQVAGTTIFTGLMAVGTMLAIKSLIARDQGLGGTGIFNAAWTLSMNYVTLITSSFATFYLPTFTQARDPVARAQLIQRLLRVVIFILAPLVTLIIVAKPLVISLLYSPQFEPSLKIMRWMLIGDYFKVTSWVFAFPMLAAADLKLYFWTELIWNAALLAMSWVAIRQFHALEGIGVGFVIVYVTYFVFTLGYVIKRHRFVWTAKSAAAWSAGLGVVLLASWITWSAPLSLP